MGNLKENLPEKYFLVFNTHNLPRGGWYQNFLKFCFDRLKKGFSHVAVVRQLADGCFLLIEGCSDRLSVVPVFERNYLDNLRKRKELTIVEFSPGKPGTCFHGIITCVSIAKYLLGIKNPAIITPYQLYKYVRKEKENGRKEF